MKKLLLSALVLVFLSSCGTAEITNGDRQQEGSLTKEDAAALLESDSLDYDPCETYGWYDDGVCDDFCPNPDPSCEEAACIQVIAYGTNPETGECKEYPTPCDVPDGYEISYEGCDDDTQCIQVIAYGTNPETGECKEYPTPCDVPDGFDISYEGCEKGTLCTEVIAYGTNPETGECQEYPTPCDVPDGFDISYEGCPGDGDDTFCIQVIAYGTNPDTGVCQQYPTPCDVPDGYEISYEGCPGDDEELCIQVIAYGTNPATGECQQYPTPCAVPDGYDISYEGCSDSDVVIGDECVQDSDCFVGGCSGQLCSAQPDAISTCEWLPAYACYQGSATSCGCNNGFCGWEQTPELAQCLSGSL